MIDHRIHGSGIDPKIEPWCAQFAEISKIVPPVRLRYDSNSVSMLLQPARYYSSSKRRMVNKGISCEDNDIYIVPAKSLDLLGRRRNHVCIVLTHCGDKNSTFHQIK